MTQVELDRILGHLTGLEMVVARSHGGWADEESLLEFRRQCWAAMLAIDDGECQLHLDLLVQYAKDLYSDENHKRWDIGPVFGVDILRRKIRMAISSSRTRLLGMERGYGKRWRDLRAA
ncbi:MAG: hypothetical protein K0R40_2361 [Burkholderiales bacterium]|jgi:hypothetical protein|nr:hypothetical protein [Burkholderiales bacterium]